MRRTLAAMQGLRYRADSSLTYIYQTLITTYNYDIAEHARVRH